MRKYAKISRKGSFFNFSTLSLTIHASHVAGSCSPCKNTSRDVFVLDSGYWKFQSGFSRRKMDFCQVNPLCRPNILIRVYIKKKYTKTAKKWGGDPDNFFTYPMEVATPKGQLLERSRIFTFFKITDFWGFFGNFFASTNYSRSLSIFIRLSASLHSYDRLHRDETFPIGVTPLAILGFEKSLFECMPDPTQTEKSSIAWPRPVFCHMRDETVSRVKSRGKTIAIIHLWIGKIFFELWWKNIFFDKLCLMGLAIAQRI